MGGGIAEDIQLSKNVKKINPLISLWVVHMQKTERRVARESSAENTFGIFQILTELFLVFAHLHPINIHKKTMASLVLMNNFKNVLKTLTQIFRKCIVQSETNPINIYM